MLRRLILALVFCIAWAGGARAAITFDQQVAGTGSAVASWTSSVSTAGTNRILIAMCALSVNSSAAPPATCVPSGASLTWVLINSWNNAGTDGSVIKGLLVTQYAACASAQLTTQTITFTPASTSYDVGRSDISSWVGQGCSTSGFELAVKSSLASAANESGTVTTASQTVLTIAYGASNTNNNPAIHNWSGSTSLTGGTNSNAGFIATSYNYRASTTGLSGVTMGFPTADNGTTAQTAGANGMYLIFMTLCNPCISGPGAQVGGLLLTGVGGN